MVVRLARPTYWQLFRGFLATNEPIAVGVELLKLFGGTEKLAPRQVAVAISIHVGKPGWDFGIGSGFDGEIWRELAISRMRGRRIG